MSIIWHNRLGHSSLKVLQQINMQYPDIICHDLSVCDACHRAKQRRLPFPVSKSNSSRCFDLIHVDI